MAWSLTIRDRERIYAELVRDPEVSCTSVARKVGCHRTTVSREVSRNGGREEYSPSEAQSRCEKRRRRSRPPKLSDRHLAGRVKAKLDDGFSPMGVSRLLGEEGVRVSHETIYRAIYDQLIEVDPQKCLRTRRKTRKRRKRDHTTNPTGNYLGLYRRISTRPAYVDARIVVGNWEGDLITGVGNRSHLITLYERVCRVTETLALPNGKNADHVAEVLRQWAQTIPEELRLTLTWDQGSELARWEQIDDLFGDGIYFADKRSPWQRPGNENNNRLLRYWFPRSQPVTDPTGERIHQALHVLNNQPRRSLNWNTPNRIYNQHLRAVTD